MSADFSQSAAPAPAAAPAAASPPEGPPAALALPPLPVQRQSTAPVRNTSTLSDAPPEVTIEFTDVGYEVHSTTGCCWRRQRQTKEILTAISGVVRPGDLVALMGASGAGKSTLLNVLSRRIRNNAGSVLINGVPADNSPVTSTMMCFIQQEDLFFGYLTVAEHLAQQADFRLPLPAAEKEARVRAIIEQFSLGKSRNSRIGNVEQGCSRGISGGERKRLSLATELLTNPSLIFADEPTSGLDAFMAEAVVEVLKALAESGHTVVSTIHQPSSDVFAMFNKVLLLSDGHMVFYGPRMAALAYFMRLGYACPPYTNPADFLIELLAVDWEDPGKKLAELEQFSAHWRSHGAAFLKEWDDGLAEKFEETFREGQLQSEAVPEAITRPGTLEGADRSATDGSPPTSPPPPFHLPKDPRTGLPRRVSWRTVMSNLLNRSIVTTARNPSVVRARLVQASVTALLGGLVYFRLDATSWYSRCGAIFFMMVNLGFMSVYTAMTAFIAEKKIVIRERDAGLYHLAMYYLSKVTSDFLFQMHLPVLYTTICWFMMGLNDSFTHYLLGCLFVWLITLGVSSYGYLIAAMAPHMGIGVALGPMLILPTLIVSGFVIQKPSLAVAWHWLYYLSPFVYGFNGLMRTVFKNVEFGAGGAGDAGDAAARAAAALANDDEGRRLFFSYLAEAGAGAGGAGAGGGAGGAGARGGGADGTAGSAAGTAGSAAAGISSVSNAAISEAGIFAEYNTGEPGFNIDSLSLDALTALPEGLNLTFPEGVRAPFRGLSPQALERFALVENGEIASQDLLRAVGGNPSDPTNGNEVLAQFGVNAASSQYAVDLLALVAWAVLGRALGCFLFCWINRRKKR